jgi:hypothetical protein
VTDLAGMLRTASTGSGTADDGVLTVSSEDLEGLWAELMPDSYPARRGLETFLDAVQAAAGSSADADLQFRPGGWQVDLRRGAVQTVVATAPAIKPPAESRIPPEGRCAAAPSVRQFGRRVQTMVDG